MLGQTFRQNENFSLEEDEVFRDQLLDQLNAPERGLLAEPFAGAWAGVRELPALGAGALGAVTGDERLADFSQKMFEGNPPPSIEYWRDVRNVGEGIRKGLYEAGRLVPNIGGFMSGAGAGVVAGKVALKGTIKAAVKKQLKDRLKNEVSDEIVERTAARIATNTAKRYGGYVGAAATSETLSVGEIYTELATDPDIPDGIARQAALTYGTVAAIPDTMVPGFFLAKFLRTTGVTSKAKQEAATNFFGNFVKRHQGKLQFAGAIPAEALTEATQEFINIAAEHYGKGEGMVPADLTPGELNRIREAGTTGALGGAMFGGAGAVVSKVGESLKENRTQLGKISPEDDGSPAGDGQGTPAIGSDAGSEGTGRPGMTEPEARTRMARLRAIPLTTKTELTPEQQAELDELEARFTTPAAKETPPPPANEPPTAPTEPLASDYFGGEHAPAVPPTETPPTETPPPETTQAQNFLDRAAALDHSKLTLDELYELSDEMADIFQLEAGTNEQLDELDALNRELSERMMVLEEQANERLPPVEESPEPNDAAPQGLQRDEDVVGKETPVDPNTEDESSVAAENIAGATAEAGTTAIPGVTESVSSASEEAAAQQAEQQASLREAEERETNEEEVQETGQEAPPASGEEEVASRVPKKKTVVGRGTIDAGVNYEASTDGFSIVRILEDPHSPLQDESGKRIGYNHIVHLRTKDGKRNLYTSDPEVLEQAEDLFFDEEDTPPVEPPREKLGDILGDLKALTGEIFESTKTFEEQRIADRNRMKDKKGALVTPNIDFNKVERFVEIIKRLARYVRYNLKDFLDYLSNELSNDQLRMLRPEIELIWKESTGEDLVLTEHADALGMKAGDLETIDFGAPAIEQLDSTGKALGYVTYKAVQLPNRKWKERPFERIFAQVVRGGADPMVVVWSEANPPERKLYVEDAAYRKAERTLTLGPDPITYTVSPEAFDTFVREGFLPATEREIRASGKQFEEEFFTVSLTDGKRVTEGRYTTVPERGIVGYSTPIETPESRDMLKGTSTPDPYHTAFLQAREDGYSYADARAIVYWDDERVEQMDKATLTPRSTRVKKSGITQRRDYLDITPRGSVARKARKRRIKRARKSGKYQKIIDQLSAIVAPQAANELYDAWGKGVNSEARRLDELRRLGTILERDESGRGMGTGTPRINATITRAHIDDAPLRSFVIGGGPTVRLAPRTYSGKIPLGAILQHWSGYLAGLDTITTPTTATQAANQVKVAFTRAMDLIDANKWADKANEDAFRDQAAKAVAKTDTDPMAGLKTLYNIIDSLERKTYWAAQPNKERLNRLSATWRFTPATEFSDPNTAYIQLLEELKEDATIDGAIGRNASKKMIVLEGDANVTAHGFYFQTSGKDKQGTAYIFRPPFDSGKRGQKTGMDLKTALQTKSHKFIGVIHLPLERDSSTRAKQARKGLFLKWNGREIFDETVKGFWGAPTTGQRTAEVRNAKITSAQLIERVMEQDGFILNNMVARKVSRREPFSQAEKDKYSNHIELAETAREFLIRPSFSSLDVITAKSAESAAGVTEEGDVVDVSIPEETEKPTLITDEGGYEIVDVSGSNIIYISYDDPIAGRTSLKWTIEELVDIKLSEKDINILVDELDRRDEPDRPVTIQEVLYMMGQGKGPELERITIPFREKSYAEILESAKEIYTFYERDKTRRALKKQRDAESAGVRQSGDEGAAAGQEGGGEPDVPAGAAALPQRDTEAGGEESGRSTSASRFIGFGPPSETDPTRTTGPDAPIYSVDGGKIREGPLSLQRAEVLPATAVKQLFNAILRKEGEYPLKKIVEGFYQPEVLGGHNVDTVVAIIGEVLDFRYGPNRDQSVRNSLSSFGQYLKLLLKDQTLAEKAGRKRRTIREVIEYDTLLAEQHRNKAARQKKAVTSSLGVPPEDTYAGNRNLNPTREWMNALWAEMKEHNVQNALSNVWGMRFYWNTDGWKASDLRERIKVARDAARGSLPAFREALLKALTEEGFDALRLAQSGTQQVSKPKAVLGEVVHARLEAMKESFTIRYSTQGHVVRRKRGKSNKIFFPSPVEKVLFLMARGEKSRSGRAAWQDWRQMTRRHDGNKDVYLFSDGETQELIDFMQIAVEDLMWHQEPGVAVQLNVFAEVASEARNGVAVESQTELFAEEGVADAQQQAIANKAKETAMHARVLKSAADDVETQVHAADLEGRFLPADLLERSDFYQELRLIRNWLLDADPVGKTDEQLIALAKEGRTEILKRAKQVVKRVKGMAETTTARSGVDVIARAFDVNAPLPTLERVINALLAEETRRTEARKNFEEIGYTPDGAEPDALPNLPYEEVEPLSFAGEEQFDDEIRKRNDLLYAMDGSGNVRYPLISDDLLEGSIHILQTEYVRRESETEHEQGIELLDAMIADGIKIPGPAIYENPPEWWYNSAWGGSNPIEADRTSKVSKVLTSDPAEVTGLGGEYLIERLREIGFPDFDNIPEVLDYLYSWESGGNRVYQTTEGGGGQYEWSIAPENTGPVDSLTAELHDEFDEVILRLERAGVDVNLLQRDLNAEWEFLQQENGAYDPRRMIYVVMNNIHNPNRRNFKVLVHEGIHFLLQGKDEATIERILAAVDEMEDLPPGADPTASRSATEQLVESLAVKFVETLGQDSKNFAQQLVAAIWRSLRRIAIGVQSALFGPSHRLDVQARKLFEEEAMAFLRGEDYMMPSFMTRIGAGWKHVEDTYRHTTGSEIRKHHAGRVLPDRIAAAFRNAKLAQQTDDSTFLDSFTAVDGAFGTAFSRNELEEYRDIPLQRDGNGNLLAPNGKKSLLNQHLWRVVRTPAFKKWFGDWENDPANASQVVDENGEPMVVYHGTRSAYGPTEVFADMSHFGTIGHANRRAFEGTMYATGDIKEDNIRVYPVFLNIRNPMKSVDESEDRYFKGQPRGDWSGEIVKAVGGGYDGIQYENRGEPEVLADTSERYAKQRAILERARKILGNKAVRPWTHLINDHNTGKISDEVWRGQLQPLLFEYNDLNRDDPPLGGQSYLTTRKTQVKSIFNPGRFSQGADGISFSIAPEDGPVLMGGEAEAAINIVANDDLHKMLESLQLKLKNAGVTFDIPTLYRKMKHQYNSTELPQDVANANAEAYPAAAGATRETITEPMQEHATLLLTQLVSGIMSSIRGRSAYLGPSLQGNIDEFEKTNEDTIKLKDDFENAALQSAQFADTFSRMVTRLMNDVRSVHTMSLKQGELTGIVQEIENLKDDSQIPEIYVNTFDELSTKGGEPYLKYLIEMAKQPINWHRLSNAAIIDHIRNSSNLLLQELNQPVNRPLLAATVALVKSSRIQMDLLSLRHDSSISDREAIRHDLETILRASEDQFEEILKTREEAATQSELHGRLKASFIAARRLRARKLKAIRKQTETLDFYETAFDFFKGHFDRLLAQLEHNPVFEPVEGAIYHEMVRDGDTWTMKEHTLHTTPDHEPVRKQAVLSNMEWLEQHPNESRSVRYLMIENQTRKLRTMKLDQDYHVANRWATTRWLQHIGQRYGETGTFYGKEVEKMLRVFSNVMAEFEQFLQPLSRKWDTQFVKAFRSSGYYDVERFKKDILTPVLYALETQPGLYGHDSRATAYALAEARKRLPHPPKKGFGPAFKNLILRYRDNSEAEVAILKKLGLNVTDDAVKAYNPYTGKYGPLVRKHIRQGWLTVPRYLNRGIIQEIADRLKEKGWSDTAAFIPETGQSAWQYIESLTKGDSQEDVGDTLVKINAVVDMMFDQRTLDTFVDPYLRMEKSIFTKLGNEPINGLMVQQLWDDADGKLMPFLMELSDAVYPPGTVTEGERIAFLTKSLYRFKQYYDVYDDVVQGMRNNPDPLAVNSETPRRMQDARTMSMFPPEHFDYDVYDTQSTMIHLAQIAFSKAFGQETTIIGSGTVHKGAVRLVSALSNLEKELEKKQITLLDLNRQYDQGSKKATRRAIIKAGRGKELKDLERQSAALPDVKHWKTQLLDIFASDQGPMKDVKALYDFVGFMAMMTLNNPKTGMWQLLSTMDFPLSMRQLNPTSVGASVKALSTAGKGAVASFLQLFGAHIFKQTDHGKSWGQYWFKTAEQQLPLREFMSNSGHQSAFLEDNSMPDKIRKKVVQRSSRWAKRLLSKGVGTGNWASFNALWAPFDWLTKVAMNGVAMGYIQGAESTVGKVAKWLVDSGNVNNPNAEATAEDVGMGGRGLFGSAETFEYYKQKLFDNDMGTIEDVARQFIAQGAKKGNSFNMSQVIALGNTAMAEVAGEGGINTNSPGFYKHPILKFGSILMRWPIFVMNRAHSLVTTKDGDLTLATTSKALAVMGMWTAPIGLAATLLMDEYDFWFLKKKSNLRELGPDQGVVGNALAVVERLARSGNVYGVGMDSINQLVNVVDPQAGQRAGLFELDSRVLVLSQLKNVQMAVVNLMKQSSGWKPSEIGLSYDTVMRPLLMSMGFNGPVQYAQIFNRAMGASNAEAKVTYKINISNWVSATARELGLELRSGGGFSSSTPMSRWVRQMLLAAYANDRGNFMQAYRRAVTEARKAFPGDPEGAEKRVLASWRSRGPFERLRYKPSDIQLGQIYSAMPNRGADALREASHRYDMYSDLIAPAANNYGPRVPSADDIRKKLMRSVTGSSSTAESYARDLFRSVTSSRY